MQIATGEIEEGLIDDDKNKAAVELGRRGDNMNWKRGLLRFWAIFSLLWLLVATGVSILAYSKQEWQTMQLTATEIAECQEADNKPDHCFFNLFKAEKSVRVWQLPPWPVLAGVVSVPFLLLVLGAAGYWVVMGFKASNQDTTPIDLHTDPEDHAEED